MLAAPLIAGNDLSRMDADTRRILTNAEVIRVDQDLLGRQGRRVWRQGDLEVWVRTLAGGERAVVLFNRGEVARHQGHVGPSWTFRPGSRPRCTTCGRAGGRTAWPARSAGAWRRMAC
jgi:hypothetical protein